MNETGLEKRLPAPLKEKAQYAVAFSLIAVMLYVAGFPIFLLFFVGVLTFFVWKVFSSEGRSETRRVFEFYLSANEILRDDDRRWYGFEIQETIARGEAIVRGMGAAPPLVYFGLGALYQKLDDHGSAVKNLTHAIEETSSNETAIVFPTKELREYVRMLRKIERVPAEAPLTSSAIRSLERVRKNRGQTMLESSRSHMINHVLPLPKAEQTLESVVDTDGNSDQDYTNAGEPANFAANGHRSDSPGENPSETSGRVSGKKIRTQKAGHPQADRQTISEVLHDIYDKNVQ